MNISIKEKLQNYIQKSKKKSIDYHNLYTYLKVNYPEIKTEDLIKELLNKGIIITKNDFYCVPKYELFTGKIEQSSSGTYYIIINDTKYNIKDKLLHGALVYDTVLYYINEDNEIEIFKIIDRQKANIVCQIVKKNNDEYILNPKKIKGTLNINISKEILQNIGDGKYVLVKVEKENKQGRFDGSIIKEIELNGKLDERLTLIAYANGFDIEFAPNTLEEANTISRHVSQKEINARNEFDFRDEEIFTIDGVDCKDMDDAIGLKILDNGNYLLNVSIADVAYYVYKRKSILLEARERGTSLYLLNTVIPMLPEILSSGVCSLWPDENRLTKSVIMEIDHNGNIINYNICNSVIKSKKKMNYDDVNKILIDGIIPYGYEEFVPTLLRMNKLSKILTRKRINDGAMAFASQEIEAVIDVDGNPISIEERKQEDAQNLIENFMLAANKTVAEYIENKRLPFVYRVHESPDKYRLEKALNIIKSIGIKNIDENILKRPKLIRNLLESLKDTEYYNILSSILLTSMARAEYTIDNIGHFALAFPSYCHFTSPIRRFPDLMVHSLLDYYHDVENGKRDYSIDELKLIEKELIEACIHSNMKERLADTAEKDAEKSAINIYMQQFVGTQMEAVITMIDARYVTIKTDDGAIGIIKYEDILGDEYLFHDNTYRIIGRKTKIKYKIGNRILVTLKNIDDIDNKLYFTLDQNISNIKEKVLTMQKKNIG